MSTTLDIMKMGCSHLDTLDHDARSGNLDAADKRRTDLGLLARADGDALAACWRALVEGPLGDVSFEWLRRPETGMIMLRGRTGGGGAPFNLGEATVTRATARLEDGAVGHGWCLGRERRKAGIIACADAMLAAGGSRATLMEAHLLEPLRRQEAERVSALAAETASTRVDFFTMVRGEDE